MADLALLQFGDGSRPAREPGFADPRFAALVEAWHQPLFSFACCLAGDETEAARLTMLTFRRWHGRDGRGEDQRWLFVTLYREFGGSPPRSLSLPPPNSPEMVAAFQHVSPGARAPLAFRYAGDFSSSEIAEILEVPLAFAIAQISRGKMQLAGALGLPDEAPSPPADLPPLSSAARAAAPAPP
jgi:hypothetical protein